MNQNTRPPAQLALTLSLPEMAELKNFVPGQNRVAFKQVQMASLGLGEFCVYLWGGSDVGKSHLLQGACEQATANNLSAIYLPLKQYKRYKPQDLEGLETIEVVCLDDIHWIVGTEWEETIFHLYNKMRANQKHMIISGDKPPATLSIKLPDLKTRLGWGVVCHMHSLSDEEKLQALQQKAAQRGMVLIDEVGKYILSRAGRSMAELHTILDQLDQASLTYQRRLTIPFIKKILNL